MRRCKQDMFVAGGRNVMSTLHTLEDTKAISVSLATWAVAWVLCRISTVSDSKAPMLLMSQ